VTGLEIVKSIQDREFTSTRILKAFIKSAVIAHEETNCITEGEGGRVTHSCRVTRVTRADFESITVLFADALEHAKELDDYFASTGKLKGPLHGIPMSLKDSSAQYPVLNIPQPL